MGFRGLLKLSTGEYPGRPGYQGDYELTKETLVYQSSRGKPGESINACKAMLCNHVGIEMYRRESNREDIGNQATSGDSQESGRPLSSLLFWTEK